MDPILFRQPSLKKLSSPEQLDDYIQVSSPGIPPNPAEIGVPLRFGRSRGAGAMGQSAPDAVPYIKIEDVGRTMQRPLSAD